MGEEHPVTYISRKLLSNEKNYSTVEKEALAIKRALDKLRYYLLGREYTLITDHASLKWMVSAKDSNTRVTRWFLALQDFMLRNWTTAFVQVYMAVSKPIHWPAPPSFSISNESRSCNGANGHQSTQH